MTEQERMDQLQQKLTALMEDESFVKRLMELGTSEGVLAAFADKGLDVTMEELKDLFAAAMAANGNELSDKELEAIAGGVWDPWALSKVKPSFTLSPIQRPLSPSERELFEKYFKNQKP